ncbi:DUF3558 domain-containing protein [Saccharomonospora xinjiangensis]|uniref:DUF3558 domain-containing protein n=1 Tax=Saccharomonospora xinjiangensis TaxID=75294 RepID=UPI001FFC9F7D|nr:DUF3558 domain-containing protein [Saccharomonospora xinjiangensis]
MKEKMTRPITLLATFATAILAASGCAAEQPGVAEPTPRPPSTAISEAPSQAAEPLSELVDPCAVIQHEKDLKEYGEFAPRQESSKDMAGARACSWKRKKQDPLEDTLIIGLAVRDKQSVDAIADVGGGINAGEINGRTAAEAPDPTSGGCTLAIAIDDGSRIDVNVLSEDVNDACDVARDIAYLIEPRLPKP